MNTLALFLLIPCAYGVAAPAVFSNGFVTPKLAALALGVLALWLPRRRWTLRPPSLGAVELFLVAAMVSAALAVDTWSAYVGQYRAPYYGLLAMFLVAVVYAGSTEFEPNELAEVLAAAGATQGCITLAQTVFADTGFGLLDSQWWWERTALLPGGRAIGTIGGAVFLGAALIPPFAAAWHLARKHNSQVARVCLALITVGLVCARAKGAWLGCAAAIWVYETEGRKRWAGLAGLWALLAAYVVLVPSPNNRERLELLSIAWEAFKDHPWFGWGPDNFYHAWSAHRSLDYIAIVRNASFGQSSAHNDIANVAVNLGLVGLAAYLYLGWRIVRETKSPFALAVLAGVFIQAQVNPIGLEVQVALACVLGSAQSTAVLMSKPEVFRTRLNAGMAVLMVLTLVASDYYARKGRTGIIRYRAAATRWSRELDHSVALVDALERRAAATQNKKAQRAVIQKALGVALRAVDRHPNEARAWATLSPVLLAAGRPFAAYSAISRSLLLDPTFHKTRELHAQLARFVKDRAGERESLRVYAAIKQAESSEQIK